MAPRRESNCETSSCGSMMKKLCFLTWDDKLEISAIALPRVKLELSLTFPLRPSFGNFRDLP